MILLFKYSKILKYVYIIYLMQLNLKFINKLLYFMKIKNSFLLSIKNL